MTITKLGHCCLIVETEGVRVLTDPGAWTTAQNDVQDIDAVLITHEHPDHLHVASLKAVLGNNPQSKVFTNSGVAKILEQERIAFQLLEHGQEINLGGVSLEGYGEKHADIYPTVPSVVNTGYLIAKRFFYPGDALYVPRASVEVLALPVAGPWIKIAEAIEYAKSIHPRLCFPVHDGMLKITGPFHVLPEKVLTSQRIQFTVIKDGDSLVV